MINRASSTPLPYKRCLCRTKSASRLGTGCANSRTVSAYLGHHHCVSEYASLYSTITLTDSPDATSTPPIEFDREFILACSQTILITMDIDRSGKAIRHIGCCNGLRAVVSSGQGMIMSHAWTMASFMRLGLSHRSTTVLGPFPGKFAI